MRFTKFVAIAITVAAFGAGAASAQIKPTQPAEFPPASYKGKQYVDSKGCVFIRAGIDGNVSWVPRVTRSRKVVCGFTPTNGASQVAAATPKPVKPAPKAAEITVDQPAAKPAAAKPAAAPAPKPAARVAKAKKPKPQRVAKVVRRTAPKPKPRVAPTPIVEPETAVIAAPAAAPKKAKRVRATQRRVRTTRTTACPGASALSQRYLQGDARSGIRCGPQAEPIVAGNYTTAPAPQRTQRVVGRRVAARTAAPTSTVSDHTRIVPKHVAIRRANTTNVKVPHGYRRVWEDGRLNPKRAEQSLSGRGHMLLVWTNTVPRRLIDPTNNKDVTATVPLVYPYIDLDTQNRELGEVTIVRRDGQLVKRIVRHRHATAKRTTRQPTYSTRSTPAPKVAAAAPKPRAVAKAKPATGGKGYVQIGLFSTKAKAQRAAQHLAGMGMGARIGSVRHKGKSYLTVQAGPFNGSDATQDAVSQLRGIGYTGAKAHR